MHEISEEEDSCCSHKCKQIERHLIIQISSSSSSSLPPIIVVIISITMIIDFVNFINCVANCTNIVTSAINCVFIIVTVTMQKMCPHAEPSSRGSCTRREGAARAQAGEPA